jgi:hypothetical protein
LFNYRKEIFAFAFRESEASQVEEKLKRNSILADIWKAGSSRWLWKVNRHIYLASIEKRYPDQGLSESEDLYSIQKFNHSPEPPLRLRQLGFRRASIWGLGRNVLPLLGSDAMFFGKLWGLYALIANMDPRQVPIRAKGSASQELFNEISDFTQDCDFPRVYERIAPIQECWKFTDT